MAEFTVSVKEKNSDRKFDLRVGGGDITSQADAEKHIAETNDRVVVVPKGKEAPGK